MRRAIRYVAPAAALLLMLTACSQDDDQPEADPTVATSPAASDEPSESPTGSPSTTPSADPSGLPTGGTSDRPAPLTAGSDLLGWQKAPGSVDSTVTSGGGWTVTVDKAGSEAEVSGPDQGSGISAGRRERISDTLLDDQYAVVVMQDRQETRPTRAVVVELGEQNQFSVDGSSDIPTVNGGTWALGQGHLLHATVNDGAYCIASVDLATQESTLGWCAPERHGFNSAHVTPAGDALTTFDDSRPSCRTVVTLTGTETEPFPGVPDCTGWEGLLLDDGAVWSVVPKAKQVESAQYYARVGDSYLDLGPGTTGTLTWCADSAYFVRDPQRDGDPAALMRFNPETGLDVVYESSGGRAFLTEPRCGGDTVTVTAFAEGGDEQVSATVR
ncbi:MAG: hypothetical protein JWO76_2077 [Nocardioides sp.]|nr:hypothetical protein [Nocardioides sp.]